MTGGPLSPELWVVEDPRNPASKVLGLTKTNLGDLNVPGFLFQILGTTVGVDDKGRDVTAGKIEWAGGTNPKSGRDVVETMRAIATSVGKKKSAATEAEEWLLVNLMAAGRPVDSATVKTDGVEVGHTEPQMAPLGAPVTDVISIGLRLVGRPRSGRTEPAALAVLLSTDLLELLQAGRHRLNHRIGPVDPLPAIT